MTFLSHLPNPRRLSTSSIGSSSSHDEHTETTSPTTSTHHHQRRRDHFRRRKSSSHKSAHSSNMATTASQQDAAAYDQFSNRRSSGASDRSCEGLTAGDCKDLWRCMLELQEAYNCYHSTRIDLAIDAGDAGYSLMPNRFIIDTLNESVIDVLPEEGWAKLDQCLHQNAKTEAH